MKTTIKNGLLSLFLILTIITPLLYFAGGAMAAEPGLIMRERGVAIGIVKKIEGALVFAKTGDGTMRYFTVSDIEKNGFQPPKLGDPALMEIDNGNQIIDIHPLRVNRFGALEGLRSSGGGKIVSATVKEVGNSLISLKTGDETTRYFTAEDARKKGLQAIHRGNSFLLEIDRNNAVIDFHPMQSDRSLSAAVENLLLGGQNIPYEKMGGAG